MNRTRGRLVVACLAVIAAAIAVAGGSAGNRTAELTFQAFGSARVTSGENIAYTLTFKNTGNSNFTHVQSRQTIPVVRVAGTDYPAALVKSTCGAVIQGNEAVCEFGSLGSGSLLRATLIWRIPTFPSATGCVNCVTSSIRLLIKEGKPTNSNEEFRSDVVAATLVGDTGGQRLEAGSYEVEPCSNASGAGSLQTNAAVSLADPVSTTFCIPSVTPSQVDLGYLTNITEFAGNPRRSDTCIAALGQTCAPGYLEKNFSPEVVTFVFKVFDGALTSQNTLATLGRDDDDDDDDDHRPPPSSAKITKVFHNGVQLTPATCSASQECLVSLTFDKQKKVWTIVATSPRNGPWNW